MRLTHELPDCTGFKSVRHMKAYRKHQQQKQRSRQEVEGDRGAGAVSHVGTASHVGMTSGRTGRLPERRDSAQQSWRETGPSRAHATAPDLRPYRQGFSNHVGSRSRRVSEPAGRDRLRCSRHDTCDCRCEGRGSAVGTPWGQERARRRNHGPHEGEPDEGEFFLHERSDGCRRKEDRDWVRSATHGNTPHTGDSSKLLNLQERRMVSCPTRNVTHEQRADCSLGKSRQPSARRGSRRSDVDLARHNGALVRVRSLDLLTPATPRSHESPHYRSANGAGGRSCTGSRSNTNSGVSVVRADGAGMGRRSVSLSRLPRGAAPDPPPRLSTLRTLRSLGP